MHYLVKARKIKVLGCYTIMWGIDLIKTKFRNVTLAISKSMTLKITIKTC